MSGLPRIKPKRPQRVYIREWREERDLTQKQLAERLEVSTMTISRWERAGADPVSADAESIPNLNTLAAISEALGGNLTASDLYRHPSRPSADALLRGQDAQTQQTAISRVIETIRKAG